MQVNESAMKWQKNEWASSPSADWIFCIYFLNDFIQLNHDVHISVRYVCICCAFCILEFNSLQKRLFFFWRSISRILQRMSDHSNVFEKNLSFKLKEQQQTWHIPQTLKLLWDSFEYKGSETPISVKTSVPFLTKVMTKRHRIMKSVFIFESNCMRFHLSIYHSNKHFARMQYITFKYHSRFFMIC